METRANHILVGAFVLLLALAGLAFVVWVGKFQTRIAFDRYDMVFIGPVTGLAVGSPVRYSGVRVGEVVEISLDRDRPDQVRVTADVDDETPVKQDTVATLQLEGLTGGRYVLLSGGSAEAPMPKAPPGARYPLIATGPSDFDELLAGAPDALAALQETLSRASRLLSDENLASVNRTLGNVESFSSSLAGRSEDLEAIIGDARATMANLNSASIAVVDLSKSLSADAERLVTHAEAMLSSIEGAAHSVTANVDQTSAELQDMIAEMRRAGVSVSGAASEIGAMVAENREPLRDFTATGLYQLAGLLAEARALVAVLNRLTTEVQRDPAQFIFGDRQQGYEAPGPTR